MAEQEEQDKPHATVEHHRTIFDSWRSMSLSLYMALLGYGVSVGVPVISSAWVSQLGFSEVDVGRVAGADLGGLLVGSIITSFLIQRMSRRTIALLGIVLAVTANALCMVFVDYDTVLWLRLLAGTGSGIYTAIAIANLGATSRPARAFNILLFLFAFTQAAEMQVLPLLSMNGIYLFFIGGYMLSVFFLRWMPSHAVRDLPDVELDVTDPSGGHRHVHKLIPSYVPWLCLCAIFVSYISIGAYWTYIELASLSSGVDPEWINKALVWGSIFSVLGALVATRISNRLGMSRPLMVALLAMAGVVGMLTGTIENYHLFASICLFNFLWLFIDVYQMGSMSVFDPTGKFVSLVPGAQGIGQIAGPNIAASILGFELGYDGVFIMCASATLTAMLIYGVMYLRLKSSIPALADAS